MLSQNRAMITRTHTKGDAPSTAIYSDCERYRYSLTRIWNADGKRVMFVMLNPSTATEVQNDPTVERCERRARALGFGALRVTNIFAWRDTDPRKMRAADDPIGPTRGGGVAWSFGPLGFIPRRTATLLEGLDWMPRACLRGARYE